jgi:hypothetical protein
MWGRNAHLPEELPSKYSVADTMDRVEAAAKGIGPLLK